MRFTPTTSHCVWGMNETVLDPARKVHLGIWRDEPDDITRAFFRWEVPESPCVCREAMAAGVRADPNGIYLGRVAQLLQPAYPPLEIGVARCADGG